MTVKTKLSARQQQQALEIIARYLGRKGLGTPICPNGRPVNDLLEHEDGSPCFDVTFGPAPTGREAAHSAAGPMLSPEWDWPGQPTPTILLEGGPEDWAYRASMNPLVIRELAAVGVFAEPYAYYALCLYPWES